MKLKYIVTAVLAATCGLAAASSLPKEDLGTGPGKYSFESDASGAFYVVLQAGTYDFDAVVNSKKMKLTDVWISYGADVNSGGSNDLSTFTGTANQKKYTDSFGPLYLATKTRVYFDVLANSTSNGSYKGFVTITAVPEPASLALMFAGIGMIGFVGSRRKR